MWKRVAAQKVTEKGYEKMCIVYGSDSGHKKLKWGGVLTHRKVTFAYLFIIGPRFSTAWQKSSKTLFWAVEIHYFPVFPRLFSPNFENPSEFGMIISVRKFH